MSEKETDDNAKKITISYEVLLKEGIVIETGEKLLVTVTEPIVDLSE